MVIYFLLMNIFQSFRYLTIAIVIIYLIFQITFIIRNYSDYLCLITTRRTCLTVIKEIVIFSDNRNVLTFSNHLIHYLLSEVSFFFFLLLIENVLPRNKIDILIVNFFNLFRQIYNLKATINKRLEYLIHVITKVIFDIDYATVCT